MFPDKTLINHENIYYIDFLKADRPEDEKDVDENHELKSIISYFKLYEKVKPKPATNGNLYEEVKIRMTVIDCEFFWMMLLSE